MRHTFKKHERLHSRKEIDLLFKNSRSLFVYPFKVLYKSQLDEKKSGAKVLFTMSHKKFKHAVQRNEIKRHLRESYRINKENLVNVLKNRNLNSKIAWIYIADTILPHQEIETKMKNSLHRLCKEFQENNI